MNRQDCCLNSCLLYLLFLIHVAGCTTDSQGNHRQSQERQSRERLSKIVDAIRSYVDNVGSVPPASLSRLGLPMHSWRTLLVPYIESNRFYNSYDLDSPWDSGRNENLISDESELTHIREVYCGKATDINTKILLVLKKADREVPYRANHSRFASGWTSRSAEFDGKIHLLELEETKIHWMEPMDYFIEEILESADLISRIRSLAIISIKTTETEFIFGSNPNVLERLRKLDLENDEKSR